MLSSIIKKINSMFTYLKKIISRSRNKSSTNSICWYPFLQFSCLVVSIPSVQLLSHVRLFATPWITACQASLSITNSRSSLKLMSIESWCHPAISSSVVPVSSCFQSLPASESFQWVNSSHEVAKVLEFQPHHQSFQWTPRTDLL